jgi:putative OPT family oligopeptide transporter
LADHAPALIAATLAFVLVAGVVIASITGYMAGLIGASNSPVSGVGILGVVAAASCSWRSWAVPQIRNNPVAMVAYALFATGIVFGIATISNDNLQDLKTGQLVGATPWRQQVALVFGVIFGALIIPPVLGLFNTAYGFAGTPGAGPNALAAPQAALISALAQGSAGRPSEPAHDRIRRADRARCSLPSMRCWAARDACGCRRSRSDSASTCRWGRRCPW